MSKLAEKIRKARERVIPDVAGHTFTIRRPTEEDVQFGRAGWLLEPPGRDQAAPDRNALARLKATLARDGERTGKPRTMAEVLA